MSNTNFSTIVLFFKILLIYIYTYLPTVMFVISKKCIINYVHQRLIENYGYEKMRF
jgi:hypothetical protein